MSELELIGSVVRLKKFAPVVDLQWADSLKEDGSLNLIENYIITSELAANFEKVLESFTLKRHERKALKEGGILDASTHSRSHIIRGQYGTGKSYFLLMVSALLEAVGNDELFDELGRKFRVFDQIRFHMDYMRQNRNKYLVVRIDGVKNVDIRFQELVQKSVISRIEKAVGEHDFYDSYGIALRKLDEYKRDPVFSKLLDSTLESRSITYDELTEGLRASKRQNLIEYREIIESITRHKIDEGFDSLESFLRAASAYVKGKGFTGIAILFDEFSAYVNASIEERRITADLASIQALAQLTIPREEQDLFFICSMHVDIGRILSNVMAAAEEIQKVRGRFSEMTLSFSNSGNIVENILIVDSRGFAALQDKYRKYFGALPVRYPDMAKVYPVHPHTVRSIIRVSSKFAQNERTIFSFFSEMVNRKTGEPVVKDERLNLITTREIYDYFIDTISERNAALKDSALRCMAFCSNELERDVVKSLVIAHVSAGENADSRLSPKDIAFIIGADDFKQIDAFLKELSMNPVSNIIFYEKEYRFEFIAAGNTVGDISSRLDEEASGINSYDALLDALEEYSNAVCIKKAYAVNPSKDSLPVRKDLEGVIYRPADLLKAVDSEIGRIEKDGKLIFVIPGFNDDFGRGFTDAVSTKMLQAPDNVCIAIPKAFPLQLEKDLKYYSAVKSMSVKNDLDESGKKTLLKIHQSVQRLVEPEIRKFGSIGNFTFIFNKKSDNDKLNNENSAMSFSSLEELQKFLLKRHYSKFPRVDADAIRGKNSIHSLIESFLIFGEKTNIPSNYTLETDRLIMDVLRPLDLVKVERSGSGFSARLKLPEEVNNPESYEIWKIINNVERPLKDVFELLEKAPYGLPDYMTELYIAAAVAGNQLIIKYRSQTVPLSKMSIALINSPGYSLEKLKSISPEIKAIIKSVWLPFCKIHGRCSAVSFDPDMPQNDSAIYSAISADLSDIRVVLDGFKARLENAGIRNYNLAALIKAINDLIFISNAVEFVDAFVMLPQRVSGVSSNTEAFEYFEKLFEFMAQLNPFTDELRKLDISINEMLCLEAVPEGFEELKALYSDINSDFVKMKRGISESIFLQEDLKELQDRLAKLVSGYNEAFAQTHEDVNKGIDRLNRLLDSNSVRLLESFEKISLRNVKRLTDIHGAMRGIKACSSKLSDGGSEPLSCTCTGYQAGLGGLLDKLCNICGMEDSIERQITNIVSNYISCLLELGSPEGILHLLKEAGVYQIDKSQAMTFEHYLAGSSETAASQWESLKNYLQMGIDTVAVRQCEEVILLVTDLYPYINKFLTGDWIEKKQAQTAPPVKRRIAFRKLYAQIETEIVNSGYRAVSMAELENTLRLIIDNIRKDYDEVLIDGDE